MEHGLCQDLGHMAPKLNLNLGHVAHVLGLDLNYV
jgi:hypothetical protein